MFREPALQLRRRARRQRGTQLVEFAIIMPVLLLLIGGIIDFGRAFHAWIILTNGAREGARVAAVGKPFDDVVQRVVWATTGLPVATADPLDGCPPPTGDTQWCIDTENLQGDRGEPVVVGLVYNFGFLWTGVMPGVGAGIPIAVQATMRLE